MRQCSEGSARDIISCRPGNCSMGLCKVFLVASLAVSASVAVRQLRGNRRYQDQRRRVQEVEQDQHPRDERSLVNTFPFNAQDDHDHHSDHHEHQAEPQLFDDLQPRDARQRNRNRDSRQRNRPRPGSGGGGDSNPVSFNEVAAAGPNRDGKRCIDKVEMIEETEYDDVVTCDHSYDKRCHTTYVTNYESQQEEECEENYRKSCFIEYETIAFNETVEICRTPLVKNCDIEGDEVCRTEYESECWTKQEVHDVEDDVVACETVVEEKCEDETSGYTTCTKEPKELCAPAGCGFKQGPQECQDKTQTVVQDAPRNSAAWSPRGPANMSPNWCQNLNQQRNVLTFLRRSAPGQEAIQGRSRNQLSRSGVICLQKSLVLPDHVENTLNKKASQLSE